MATGLPSSEARDACYPAWLGAVSSAWLERLLDTQEVRGSNPLRPTEGGSRDFADRVSRFSPDSPDQPRLTLLRRQSSARAPRCGPVVSHGRG